jgi:hypothetical protein
MSMERLTEEDRFMLWPDEIWPQDIGALALLDGSRLIDSNGAFRIDALREAVASRLHLVPRFRQLLYIPPRRLGVRCGLTLPPLTLPIMSQYSGCRLQATRHNSCWRSSNSAGDA